MNNRVAQIVVGSNGRQVAASMEAAYQRLAADFLEVPSKQISADPVAQLAAAWDWPTFLGDVVRLRPAAVLAAHVAINGGYGDVVEIIEHDLERPLGHATECQSIDLAEPGSPGFALSLAILNLEHGEESVDDRADALLEELQDLVESALVMRSADEARDVIRRRDAAFAPEVPGLSAPLLSLDGDAEAALRAYPGALIEVYRSVAARLWPEQSPAL